MKTKYKVLNEQGIYKDIQTKDDEITMATISEDFVSFETAKLLKEKGFNGKCSMYYDTEEIKEMEENGDSETIEPEEVGRESIMYDYTGIYIKAPTQSMAMKWLREEKSIFIDVYYEEDIKGYMYSIIKLIKGTILNVSDLADNSYEEAIEEAIKYCLENLI